MRKACLGPGTVAAGHWEPVLPKNRSADLFADLLGFVRRFGGGGVDTRIPVPVVRCPSPISGGGGPSFGDSPPGTIVPGGGL